MIVTATSLEEFVAASDRIGGPGTAATNDYWRDFKYRPTCLVDTALDPDGEAYFSQMMSLYEEIAGRKIDQSVTELTQLDVARLATKESPYADTAPSDRAVHYLRLARAVHSASLPAGGSVLDMGCGWGLSSEFLAQLGFSVVAVDINPLFVELVTQRARRLNFNIAANRSSFEDFPGQPGSFDAILFYECFHHAVRPRQLLEKITAWLKPGGKLILAGEPIQANDWPAWGLRLDALSVYCIKKFGWFESGWSADYLRRIIAGSGLLPSLYNHADPLIGTYVVGSPSSTELGATVLDGFAVPGQWWMDGEYLISNRQSQASEITLYLPSQAGIVCCEIYNFSPSPMSVDIFVNNSKNSFLLKTGVNEIRMDRGESDELLKLRFECNSWCPAEVLSNGDDRQIGFHLKRVFTKG